MRLDHVRDQKRAIERARFGNPNPFAMFTEDQRRARAMTARQDNSGGIRCGFCGHQISGLGARCPNAGPNWPHPTRTEGRA